MEARASDVLPRVRVPVLIVAPERDVMVLRGDLGALRDGIRGAEWRDAATNELTRFSSKRGTCGSPRASASFAASLPPPTGS